RQTITTLLPYTTHFRSHLEIWDDKKQYERLGIDEETMKIMDVHIPKATIPVRPGRNLAVIIEVAAMNFRLKEMGVNAAEEFSDQDRKSTRLNSSHVSIS